MLRREDFIAADDRTAWSVATEPLRYQYTSVYDWKGLDPAIDDDALRRDAQDRFIVGGPETVREEILRYRDAVNAAGIIFRVQLPKLPPERVMEAIRLLGEWVLPDL
jgi:alkanesulfonate monooxygenase SsuD/methylene tetrahydromethanopterin reductase-like flavin-dependent oxidoreductase (luciferase family)